LKSWVLLGPTRTSVTKYPCGNLTWNIQAELLITEKIKMFPPTKYPNCWNDFSGKGLHLGNRVANWCK